MITRFFDLFGALFLGIIAIPILLLAAIAIWLDDWNSPFYIAKRIGRNGVPFDFIKLRTISLRHRMPPDEILSSNDPRISSLGRFLRKSKIDELPQFWHVLTGDMSLVGPRPSVPEQVRFHNEDEKLLLSIRPGITDLASVVFRDLGNILTTSKDTKTDYNLLVRPLKSRLALVYVHSGSVKLYLTILWLTALSFISHSTTVSRVYQIASNLEKPREHDTARNFSHIMSRDGSKS